MLSYLRNLRFRGSHNRQLPPVSATFGPPTYLRNGKWVIFNDRVGILTDVSGYPDVGIMLTDEKGENLAYMRVPAGQIRLARLAEIPEPRRPDPERGASLGYL